MDWSFLHGDLLLAIGLFAVSLVASMAAVAGILVLIAPDHFVRIDPRPSIAARGARAIAVRIAKNLLGVVLVAVGIVLSVPGVPGQGLLTILVGIMLIDLPRKRELELRIVSRPWVRRSVDRLRIRFGKAPLRLEPESPPAGEATGG